MLSKWRLKLIAIQSQIKNETILLPFSKDLSENEMHKFKKIISESNELSFN